MRPELFAEKILPEEPKRSRVEIREKYFECLIYGLLGKRIENSQIDLKICYFCILMQRKGKAARLERLEEERKVILSKRLVCFEIVIKENVKILFS